MPSNHRSDQKQCDVLESSKVKFVRLLFVDFAGIRRCRVCPIHRWGGVTEDGIGLTMATVAMPAWGDFCAQGAGFGPVGEIRLTPAPNGFLKALPWHPGHAIAASGFYLREPSVRAPLRDFPWLCCPRAALAKVLDLAQSKFGFTFRVGYESEFMLLHRLEPGSQPPFRPVDNSVYSQSSAFDAMAPVLDDMVAAVDPLNVEQLHAESGPGQFEIVTGHKEAMEATDALLYTREAICAVAAKHKLTASFLPKLSTTTAGSGAHLHISIMKDGRNLFEGFSQGSGPTPAPEEAFLAGILHHMPALQTFTTPSPLSYERLQPGCWSGAYQVWGVNNREAPLRLCSDAHGEPNNAEYKTLDATANPYLALAVLIIAGLEGINQQRRLPEPTSVDPGNLEESERKQRGIKLLCTTLRQSLDAFTADAELRNAVTGILGAPLVQAFLAVRASELSWYSGFTGTPAEIVDQAAAQLYDRY
ncbi:g6000 [Coccomyxa viridis]|uniref:G6000 protein n=1 Tax=Coccomyxa viridis TaxID=1274662 RepID=A0ABP1FZE3_9CHLO